MSEQRSDAANTDSYRQSFRRRRRILFSPLRLALFLGAIVFGTVLNVVYIRNGAEPEWLGALSVAPIFAFVAWMLVTDHRERRREREL